MKSKKFLVIIIIILLFFVVWLAQGNETFLAKFKTILPKISDNIAPDTTDENPVVSNENNSNPLAENKTDKISCGDNLCSPGEDGSCCQDCGCLAGNYCTDSGKCEKNIPFKPIPNKPDFHITTDLSAINLVNFKPNFSNIIGLDLNNSQQPSGNSGNLHETEGVVISPYDYYAVQPPHIYGDKVVFSQYYKPGVTKGFIYDISTGKLDEIPYGHAIQFPDIGMQGIVWVDYSRGTSEGSDIYYYNPIDNQQGFISPRNIYQASPKISGRSLAWAEDNQDLYLYWLPSGEEIKVFYPDHRKFFSDFAINNGRMVFSIFENKDEGTFYEVYLYDLGKHEYRRIAQTGESRVEHVSIDADNVVYVAGGKIFIYNLKTKLTKKVEDISMNGQGIVIYGDKIIFSAKAHGNKDLFYYNLHTGETKQLTYDEADDDLPDIYGNMVVYVSGGRKVKLLQIK